jgi:ferredoxin
MVVQHPPRQRWRSMFRLRLVAKHCISCAICMDVCSPAAIDMRPWRSRTPEGCRHTYLGLQSSKNRERAVSEMASFPYLAQPQRCNGCGQCVQQCPASALLLLATESS